MTIENLPLKQLERHPDNVRSTTGDDQKPAGLTELIASILSVGIVSPLLVVEPKKKGGKYQVLDGGRRFAAAQILAKRKQLVGEIPVKVIELADREVEAGLAVNTVREALDGVDEIRAFKRLVETGLTTTEIANRFGCTVRLVEQRLALAGVIPEALDAAKAGKVGLRELQALAITADQELQRNAWVTGKQVAYRIKDILTASRISSRDKRAEFVGEAAYRASGASIEVDLFYGSSGESVWWGLADQLTALAQEKLDSQAEAIRQVEGWSWAEGRIEFSFTDKHKFGAAQPAEMDLPKAEAKEWKALEKEATEIEDWIEQAETEADGDDLYSDEDRAQEERLNVIRARLVELTSLKSSLAVYSAEAKAAGGIICTISGDDGRIMEVHRGMIKPEDLPKKAAAKKALGVSGPEIEDRKTAAAGRTDGYSASLAETVKSTRREIARHAILDRPALALRAVAAQLAVELLGGRAKLVAVYLGQRVDPERSVSEEVPSAMEACEHRLAELLDLPDSMDSIMNLSDTVWASLLEMKDKEVHQVFAVIAAAHLTGQLSTDDDAADSYEDMLQRAKPKWMKLWRGGAGPSAENFWNRLRADQLKKFAENEIFAYDEEASRPKPTLMPMRNKAELVAAVVMNFRTQLPRWLPAGFDPAEGKDGS